MNYVTRLFALLFAAVLIGSIVSPAEAQDAPFITVWDTENLGETNDDQIKIPGAGTNYQIIWEEVGNTSNTDTLTATDVVTITFPSPGFYRVKISGSFSRIHSRDTRDQRKIIQIEQWGDIEWSTMEDAFVSATNLDLSAEDVPNLSSVTSMAGMFSGAHSLNATGSSIGSWETSNITNMSSMFVGAGEFNQDISSWDTGSVVNMSDIFSGASSFNQDIGVWNTGNVTDMTRMFRKATSFNQDISQWDVGRVTSMAAMFLDADSFDKNLNIWNTSNVSNMSDMFGSAGEFNGKIGNWDVSNVSNMSGMFSDALEFNRDISNWHTDSLVNMESMFSGAVSFNVDISSWDVSNVTSMKSSFSDANTFNKDIGTWDTADVTKMSSMFKGASSFDQDISSWKVSSVESMNLMFLDASAFNQDLGRWNIANVSSMIGMFNFSGVSSENYDKTLTGWSVRNNESGVELGANTLRYCNASPFRNHLTEARGWSIEGDGIKNGCPKSLSGYDNHNVSNNGTYVFEGVHLDIKFRNVIGSGRVTSVKINEPPEDTSGIREGKVSKYRVIVSGAGIPSFESADLQFSVGGFSGIRKPSGVTVYNRSQPNHGSFDSLATSVDDNGTPDDASDDVLVVSTDGSDAPVNGFGEFVFASDNNELPVELASFNGTTTDRNVRLTWQTASEQNNAGFEVQRKKESEWNQMGYVESKAEGGSTTETQSYQFTAEDLSVGTHQFRLKQVDLDGSSQVHGPISVDVQMQEALKLTAPAPNPVSSTSTLSFAVKEKSETTIALYDLLGRRVTTLYDGTPTPGQQQRVQMDASSLPSGAYLLRLRAAGRTETQRVTVLR